MKRIQIILLITVLTLFLSACKVKYSFNGGTLSPDVKTFSVQYFPNRALLVNPTLSTQFTEALKEKFRSQTTLDEVIDAAGNLNFEGEIVGYDMRPMNIQQGEMAAKNRLTVTIKVRFTNEVQSKYDFDKKFSAFADFDSTQDFSSVENSLLEEILRKIIDDIYNQSVVNW